ncbi:hypothetical protein X801_08012, partial [Opisthorchis viverrini]
RKDDKDQDDSDWSVKSAKSNRPRDTLNAPREEEELDSDPNIVDRLWGRLLPDIGRVYVFHGFPSNLTSNTLHRDILRLPYLASTYSYQVIWPAELPRAAPITTCGDFDTHDSGHRMFKSFGRSLSAGIDLDGNHPPDLIAGDFESDQLRDVSQVLPFPYCPNVSISVGKSKLPDYLSRPPVILDGPKSVGGRFGHSVVSMGDVNGGSTEYLAISCPYCSDPEGTREKEWSLSAGIDLDGNHAPDLIAGDFDSNQARDVSQVLPFHYCPNVSISVGKSKLWTWIIHVVFLRARNTIWFDSSEWDLPLARTLPWSGPDETECGTQCQFRVQLSVRVHGKPSLLQRHQTEQFKLHVAVDMDASIVNLVYKRLAGVSDMQNIGVSGFMSMGLLESVLPITIIRDTLMNKNRMVLLSLTLEP